MSFSASGRATPGANSRTLARAGRAAAVRICQPPVKSGLRDLPSRRTNVVEALDRRLHPPRIVPLDDLRVGNHAHLDDRVRGRPEALAAEVEEVDGLGRPPVLDGGERQAPEPVSIGRLDERLASDGRWRD